MATVERPTAGDVEERTVSETLAVDGKKIRGRIPYSVESRAMPGGWREVIEPGALKNAKLDRLLATVNHGGGGSLPIGRYPNTLELEDRADGMHWSVDPPLSRADVREAVERGDLNEGSWRMVVGKEEWRGDVRHVLEIAELKDVCVAVDPAVYPQAQVEYRTQPEVTQEEVEMDQQDQQEGGHAVSTPEQHDGESRTRPPAGSLRVEERAEAAIFHSLADLYDQRGFFENRVAEASWDEFRAVVWSAGTVLTDLNPLRRDGVPLGYDQRWLFPVLPTTAVSDATTSVQYLRQSGRTLAGTAVIRPLDAVTTKPSVAGTAELVSSQLQQVAAIHPDIPRIHQAQPLFQSIVETDLRLSINDGLDEVVRRGVTTAGTAAAVTGNIVDKIRKAKTVVQAQGYSPNVLAIDPAGAEALDLLVTGISGGTADYVFTPGQPAPAPWGLQLRIWKTAGTAILDADSFGRLYVAPVELRSFEQDAGATNRQTVRMETNALFAVERLPAALRIL